MSGRFNFVSFTMILVVGSFFSSCSVAPRQNATALRYENSQIVKDFENVKNHMSNAQNDKDEGYCPLCEL